MLATDPTTTDTRALPIATELVAQLERAWNAADGAAFGEAFVEDADFVNVRGEHHRGSVAVARGHQGIFESIYAGSTVTYRVESARATASGDIVAVAAATLEVPSGPLAGVLHSRFTAVLTDEGQRWAVEAFHNTLVADGA